MPLWKTIECALDPERGLRATVMTARVGRAVSAQRGLSLAQIASTGANHCKALAGAPVQAISEPVSLRFPTAALSHCGPRCLECLRLVLVEGIREASGACGNRLAWTSGQVC